MKTFLFYLLFIITITANSQITYKKGNYIFYKAEKSNKTKGTKFLLKKFVHNGVITTFYNKSYETANINIDLTTNNFVSKINKDSLFVYNNLKKVVIDGDVFEKRGDKIFRVISKGKKISLYKYSFKEKTKPRIDKYSKEIKSPSKWKLREEYFYEKNGNGLKKIKLKKRNFLKLLKSNKYVKEFIKKESLSIKKDKDLEKILNYYNNL